MSYTEEDARWDELWDQMSKELYPEHKEQAIDEFIRERLQSFYLKNPTILTPGIRMYQEARELEKNHPSASFVFATSAIELFLKAALLKPVVYGLVHNDPLAEIVVETALSQSGFERYKELLSRLFRELVGINVETLKNFESNDCLLKEASKVQKTRNKIIHQGILVANKDAQFAINVAYGVLHHIVNPMLLAIGLWMDKKGTVLERKEGKEGKKV
jgi:hypothetical protein